MRQDFRELSHQEVYSRLRSIRESIMLLDQAIESITKDYLISDGPPAPKRVIDGLQASSRWLRGSRASIREVLETMDATGHYPDPPADIPNSLSLSFGLTSKSLRTISDEIESREEKLKDLTVALSEYYMEGWTIRHTEDAVMCLTRARHDIRFCSSKLSDEESTSEEEESVQSISDSLHNAGGGFSASGKPGRH